MSLPPEPTAEPSAEPQPLFSENHGVTQEPPASPPIRGGTYLPVPDGTHVLRGDCTSDGTCYPYNFYWAPTREAIVLIGEGANKVQHELCHAHQHWSINGGASLPPADYDLESWYATEEGRSFTAAVAGLRWPWSHSAANGLEDFAWTCAYWYLDPAYLLQVSPQRYEWAAGRLP